MTDIKHSPLPWKALFGFLIDAGGDQICESVAGSKFKYPEIIDHEDANAELIVRAVNSHDALVKALEPFAGLAAVIDGYGHEPRSTCTHRLSADDIRQARSALALAKGDKT